MLSGVVTIFITGIISFIMIGVLKRQYRFVDETILRLLFLFHVGLGFVYYLYATFNPSDSIGYYRNIQINFRGETWMEHYGTSTTFVEFLAYPFIKYFNFSYEASMALFAFFGFIGFVFFYIFFKEHLNFNHSFLGLNLVTLIFFLPNLHFWASSLGKGSVVFMGLGLYFYGIGKVRTRWLAIFIGGLIIYHVRPHIMLVTLVSSAAGFVFSTRGVSVSVRLLFLAGASVVFYFTYSDVLKKIGINEDEVLTQGLNLSHRAHELQNATSGVDINSYSLPMQVFTFLYRPLFFDAPGTLGLIVSFENVFYLLLTFRILSRRGLRFIFTSNFLVKAAFFSFLTVTIVLAQISGNLGLAMRQKSQVLILFLFVILSFLDKEKMEAYQFKVRQQMRKGLQKTKPAARISR